MAELSFKHTRRLQNYYVKTNLLRPKFSYGFCAISLLHQTQVGEIETSVFPTSTGVRYLRISGALFYILRDNKYTRRLYFLWDNCFCTWRIPYGLVKTKWSTPCVLYAKNEETELLKTKAASRIHQIRSKLADILSSLVKEPSFVTLVKALLYSS